MRSASVVAALSGGQWGLLTTAQARAEGITRQQLSRLASAGVLERLGHGVYALTGAPDDERRELRAAWLALEPASTAEQRLTSPGAAIVVSHASAASLHRLGDLLDDVCEFTSPERIQTRRPGIRIHRLPIEDEDVAVVDGLPVTTPARTIADLLGSNTDTEHVGQMVAQGVRRGIVDVDDLSSRLEPLARRHRQRDGGALLAHLLDLAGLSTESVTRDLARTAAGATLLEAGRLDIVKQMLSALGTYTDALPVSGLVRAVLEGNQAAGGGLAALQEAVMAQTGLLTLSEFAQAAQSQVNDGLLKLATATAPSSALLELVAASSPHATGALAALASGIGETDESFGEGPDANG